jgi:hypothetical protein
MPVQLSEREEEEIKNHLDAALNILYENGFNTDQAFDELRRLDHEAGGS